MLPSMHRRVVPAWALPMHEQPADLTSSSPGRGWGNWRGVESSLDKVPWPMCTACCACSHHQAPCPPKPLAGDPGRHQGGQVLHPRHQPRAGARHPGHPPLKRLPLTCSTAGSEHFWCWLGMRFRHASAMARSELARHPVPHRLASVHSSAASDPPLCDTKIHFSSTTPIRDICIPDWNHAIYSHDSSILHPF